MSYSQLGFKVSTRELAEVATTFDLLLHLQLEMFSIFGRALLIRFLSYNFLWLLVYCSAKKLCDLIMKSMANLFEIAFTVF